MSIRFLLQRWLVLTLFLINSCLFGSTVSGTFQTITPGTNVNLSSEGALDWVHWGTFGQYDLDRKAGVIPQISDITFLPDGPYWLTDNQNGYSWFDGQPTGGMTNTTTGIYETYTNSALEFTAPADTTTRVLKVYVGAYGAQTKFTASLSDGGIYTSTNFNYTTTGPAGVYTLTYTADSSDQTLTIDFIVAKLNQGDGNVTLQAATLAYSTNNNPPTVGLTSPADNAVFAPHAPITLEATGVDLDGTITNVQYFAGATPIGLATAAPYTVIWSNATPGEYLISAVATDNSGEVSPAASRDIFIVGTGGTLSASYSGTGASIDLSIEGQRDWAHWGLTNELSFDHKAGVTPVIPNFTVIGEGFVEQINDNSTTAWSWQSGTPVSAVTNSRTYVFMRGYTNGFELHFPASTNRQTVKLHTGLFSAQGQLQAFLDDFSATPFIDTSFVNIYDYSSRTYTISYTAPASGRNLIVRYTAKNLYDSFFGSVSLAAAAVIAPFVELTNPVSNATFSLPATISLQANATNADGLIAAVDFYSDNIFVGHSVSSPYWFDWTNAPAGTHSLTAQATDVYGRITTSAPILISVNSGATPVPIHQPAIVGTNVSLSFLTVSNSSYEVDFTDSFSPTNWQVLTNLVGNGLDAVIQDGIGTNRQRFYRLIIGP